MTQWFRPRRRRYALGGAAARYALGGAAAVTAALVFFVGFPRAQPASIALSDTALDLTPGDTAPVRAVVLDAAGDTLASNVQWTTADGARAVDHRRRGRCVRDRRRSSRSSTRRDDERSRTRRSNREDGRGVRR